MKDSFVPQRSGDDKRIGELIVVEVELRSQRTIASQSTMSRMWTLARVPCTP